MKVTIDFSGLDLESAVTEPALTRFKRYAMELYRRVIMKTPVDTGRLRGNWQVSKRQAKTDRIGRLSKTIEMLDSGVITSLQANKLGGIPAIFLANNLPYADVVESGKYPNPPKRGSRVKGVGWVQKSQNGFSKKAPQGMARISIQELMEY